MFCKQCGKPIDDGAVFCQHCGANQQTTNVPPQQPYQNAQQTQPQQPPYSQPNVVVPNVVVNVDNQNNNTVIASAKSGGYKTKYVGAISPKSKGMAMMLAIFLGYFGAHQFYAGKKGMGLLYLFTGGLCGIGWIWDIIKIAKGDFKDSNGLLLLK